MTEGPAREALRFSVLRKNAALQRAYLSLNDEGRKSVMDHAEAVARHRGFSPEMIGWGLTVMRARNEALDQEFPDVEKHFPADFPRSSQESHDGDDGWANRE